MDITTIVIAALGILVLILMACCVIISRARLREDPFDDMQGDEFELYCAELLEKQGFEEVVPTKKSRDFGVDIFADKDGISYAIQCKCYSDTVGIKAIQEVYAGRDFYDCMVGVVMTNQYFSKPAREFAAKLNVLLWDGDYISWLIREYGGSSRYKKITDTTAQYERRKNRLLEKKRNRRRTFWAGIFHKKNSEFDSEGTDSYMEGMNDDQNG